MSKEEAAVDEHAKILKDAVSEVVGEMKDADIPTDWIKFNPCDPNGDLTWRWQVDGKSICLVVEPYAETATILIDDSYIDGGEPLSFKNAVKKLKTLF